MQKITTLKGKQKSGRARWDSMTKEQQEAHIQMLKEKQQMYYKRANEAIKLMDEKQKIENA